MLLMILRRHLKAHTVSAHLSVHLEYNKIICLLHVKNIARMTSIISGEIFLRQLSSCLIVCCVLDAPYVQIALPREIFTNGNLSTLTLHIYCCLNIPLVRFVKCDKS